ncbi:MAG: hypothetical protein U0136_17965 [Bdellovibrionota bacterium]
MLLQQEPNLEELILKALVDLPGATAKAVLNHVQQNAGPFTIRGIYKELAKLQQQGILLKQGETYHVRLAWIMNLLAFGDRAYERYTSSSYLARSLSPEKQTERFSDLVKLDRLWTQLILTYHQLHPKSIMCFWCPYQWFALAHELTCRQFYDAINLTEFQRCHIIGDDTFLARRAVKDLPKKGVYSFAKSPFDDERSTYYTVIADVVLTVRIDKETTARLHHLFHSVRSESELNPNLLDSVFGRRIRATLTTEVNASKALRLKRKFADYFGMTIA